MDSEQDCFENMASQLGFLGTGFLRMIADVNGGSFYIFFSLLAFDSKEMKRASGSYTCTLLPPALYTEPMRNDLRVHSNSSSLPLSC